MNLRRKTIQNSYLVPGRNQRIHQVRPYESCSTRYQNVSTHADSAPIRTSEVFFAGTYLRTAHRAKSTKSSALRGGRGECGGTPRGSGVKQRVKVVVNGSTARICRSNHASAPGRNRSAQLIPVRKCLMPRRSIHAAATSNRGSSK